MTTDPTIDPFEPATIGPITLRNRFIKAATFEGLGTGKDVGDDLIDFHRAVASGGVGLTTLAFCAVSRDGRGAPKELIVRPELVVSLRRFTEAINADGAAAAIQLGHAGPVAAAVGRGGGLAPSRVFAPQALRFTRPATEDDLCRIVDDFGAAAAIAVEAGFSVIELHFGHGYLVSSFLSPKLNRRTDRWGGSVERRARLARAVAERVRERAGSSVAVTAKLNMADGVAGGLWLDDSVATALLLEADGTLDALELTGGSSFQNPMYLFRGDAPVAEMAALFPQPLRLGLKLTARKFMPTYPFEEAFFLPYARQFRDALSMPLVLLGGINRLDTVTSALAEGFQFVAMARALLREPDLVNRWRVERQHEGLCVHCNKCMPSIYRGTHCVLVPPEERPGRIGSS
ncbi:MAG: NADH:flavin oxidoreductase [Actinobacteria bacterium]|nr:NADH:flavin oxidoreductase [Actinomycetota bacterium]